MNVEAEIMNSTVGTLMRLINPLGFPEKLHAELAPRLESFADKTIGLIDNIKPNAGLFLSYIEEMLKADYPSIQFQKVRKNFTSSRLIADQLVGKVNGVVNAWGD